MATKKNEKTTMTMSGVPASLVQLIDERARKNGRSRSSETVRLLKEIVAIKKSTQPAEAHS